MDTKIDIFDYFATDPFCEFPLLLGDQDYNYWFPEEFTGYIPSGNEIMACLENEFYNTSTLQKESMKRKREEECYGFQHLFDNEQYQRQTQTHPSDVSFVNEQQENQFKMYVSFLKYLYQEHKIMPNSIWNTCYLGKNTLGYHLLTYSLFMLGAEIVLDYVIIKELQREELLS